MERVSLSAEIREGTGKGYARKARKEGKVPAVLYGKDTENKNLLVEANEVDRVLRHHGLNVLVDLEIEGEKNLAMFREVQRDVLTPDILHVDFLRISIDKELETTVPLVLTGNPVGITKGGVLQQQLREVDIKALPTNIPHSVEVDISHLEVGDSVTVADITEEKEYEILNDPEEVIASIVTPRAVEEEGVEAEEAEETEEAEAPAEEPEKEEGDEA